MQSPESKYSDWVSVDDVRCPICDGVINQKWYDSMSDNIAIFIAECWSGKVSVDQPAHIFRFHIKLPESKTYEGKVL